MFLLVRSRFRPMWHITHRNATCYLHTEEALELIAFAARTFTAEMEDACVNPTVVRFLQLPAHQELAQRALHTAAWPPTKLAILLRRVLLGRAGAFSTAKAATHSVPEFQRHEITMRQDWVILQRLSRRLRK